MANLRLISNLFDLFFMEHASKFINSSRPTSRNNKLLKSRRRRPLVHGDPWGGEGYDFLGVPNISRYPRDPAGTKMIFLFPKDMLQLEG